ncbi:MAG: ABC transporter ATP-binding protein [Alphaproteobacteria bacterium]|nr:ABC transporter ATP-binding protein [Alphaproteobacteria bacterium]
MTPLLSVQNLQKSFGGVKAVKDVSFDLEPGKLLALIGPNGAGKSTTFNCLNGQLAPDGGKVLFESKDITGLSPQKIWRLGIGRTFQITATFLSMSVIENVQMTLLSWNRGLLDIVRRARRQHEARAMELLEMVGLADQADSACSILAYGDLKRLELAMALANDPKLLFMDEPTAGMGVKERERLMDLAHNIAREKQIGILFTEHDMTAVFGHADEIIVLHRGELIAKGGPEEIRGNKAVRDVYLGTEGEAA